MSMEKRLRGVMQHAPEIVFDDHSRLVMMSDCHRGDGSRADNYATNALTVYHALSHYYRDGYTYIELGDGDELWENRHFDEIVNTHSELFSLLSRFYCKQRLYMLYGNHDLDKRDCHRTRPSCRDYVDPHGSCRRTLPPDMVFHEGLWLRHRESGGRLLLIHGHQGDLLSDRLWPLARFLVRYVWRSLELIGLADPFNTSRRSSAHDRLSAFAEKHRQPLIAGHTHHPVFPYEGDPPFFNDGCCVQPYGITALEIAGGFISLIKWSQRTHPDGSVYVGRQLMEGPIRITAYFNPAL